MKSFLPAKGGGGWGVSRQSFAFQIFQFFFHAINTDALGWGAGRGGGGGGAELISRASRHLKINFGFNSNLSRKFKYVRA